MSLSPALSALNADPDRSGPWQRSRTCIGVDFKYAQTPSNWKRSHPTWRLWKSISSIRIISQLSYKAATWNQLRFSVR